MYYGPYAVFRLALSNMAQRHAAFCALHVALHERHVQDVALLDLGVMLPFISSCVPCCPSDNQTVKFLFELLLRHIQPTQANLTGQTLY